MFIELFLQVGITEQVGKKFKKKKKKKGFSLT